MADNIELNSGSGGSTIATDDDGTAHHQYVKLEFGADNTQTKVTSSAGLPVTPDSSGFDVTNAGTFAVQVDGAALTALQLIDDAVAAEGAALGKGILLQGDDGTDRTNVLVDAAGHLQVDVLTAPTTTVTGTVAATQSGSWTVTANAGTNLNTSALVTSSNFTTVFGTASLVTTATLADNLANTQDVLNVRGLGYVFDGSTWDRMRGDSADGVLVNLGSNNDVTVTGTVDLGATDNAVLDAIQAAVETIDNAISGSEMQVDVVGSLPAGTNAIGKLAANSGVDIGDVDVTSISAGSNLIGDVGLSGARTSGGTTFYRNVDVDETEDAVKASAGQLYWIHAMNLTAAVLYLHFYNASTGSVTVGTTTPDLTFPLPTQGDTNGAGFTLAIPNGIAFGTAITVACTTTVGGSSGPAANGCIVNLGYA